MTGVLINGQAGHGIDSADRGLQYGDGLFETIACRDGAACWLPLHLERLQQGCERLRIAFREFDLLRAEIGGFAAGQQRCIVKVIVTRGTATRRGYAPAGDEQPTRIVSRHDWPQPAVHAAAGFKLGISSVTLGTNPRLAGLKHLNRLEQVLAQMERDAAEVDEVLMLSTAGQVIGGSMSNVFLADDGGLFTPELGACGVAGVMRRLVLEAAVRLGQPVCVRPVAPSELAGVREAFVTNVRWGVQSAQRLNGRTLAGDARARQLRQVIDAARA
ncbi:MAG TPA: aminodeoxychorismate lyase [Steroidobacteraceae bacterium]|nr:aminodeoxychorismate lyase [Steroidobacteraceae bacterium]